MASSVTFDLFARDRASGAFTKVGQAAERTSRSVGGLNRVFGRVSAGSRGVQSSFGAIGKTAAFAAGAAGIAALTLGFKNAYQEGREAQKVGAQTAAVIKSTGGAANVSAGQVSALAGAISNKVGVDDEAIQSGANLLLTFTGIRNEAGKGNDIFNQATRVVTDMTAAMNGGKVTQEGLKTASIQVGKALNDPIKGMTALRKVGVSFTDQQQVQIKAMVASGNVLGARKVILAELNKEFAGSAAAGTNAMQKLRVIFGNIAESVGTVLLPILDRFASWLAGVLPGALATASRWLGAVRIAALAVFDTFRNGAGSGYLDAFGKQTSAALTKVGLALRAVANFVTGTVIPALQKLGGFIAEHRELFIAMGKGVAAVTAAFAAFRLVMMGVNLVMAINPIGVVIVALGALAGGVIYAYKHSERFRAIVATVWAALQQVGAFLMRTFTPTFQALAQTVRTNVLPSLLQLWAVVQRNMPAFIAFAKFIGAVIAVVAALAAKILGFLLPILARLAGFLLGRLFGLIAQTVQYFGNLVRAVQSAWGTFRAFLAIVGEVWRRFIAATSTAIGRAVDLITGIKAKVLGAITGAKTWLVNIGKDVIGGLWSGFKSAMAKVGEVLGGVKDAIVGGLKRLFHIGSPSKVMAELGGHMITGLIKGLLTQSGALANTVKSIGGNIAGIFGGIDLGFGKGSTSAGAMQSMVQGYAQMLYGWTGAQWTALNKLLTRESGFNPNAQNPTSTAYGLFQFLDSTWATVNARKTSNPQAQTWAGLRYIKQAWGDPIGAWNHEMQFGWYGKGLPPTVFSKPTLIGVGESGPETVSVIPRGRPAAGAGSVEVTLNFYGPVAGSVRQFARDLAPAIQEAISERLDRSGRKVLAREIR